MVTAKRFNIVCWVVMLGGMMIGLTAAVDVFFHINLGFKQIDVFISIAVISMGFLVKAVGSKIIRNFG